MKRGALQNPATTDASRNLGIMWLAVAIYPTGLATPTGWGADTPDGAAGSGASASPVGVEGAVRAGGGVSL